MRSDANAVIALQAIIELVVEPSCKLIHEVDKVCFPLSVRHSSQQHPGFTQEIQVKRHSFKHEGTLNFHSNGLASGAQLAFVYLP